jgi:hypothetical protein
MKCWHLVAALALAGCGLNTTALPSKDRQSEDAGVGTPGMSIAGSPATWPTRRRPAQLEQDGGTGDTNDASKPSGSGPATNDTDAQVAPGNQSDAGTSANPSGPGAQPPGNGGPASGPSSNPSKPGSQAKPPASGPSNGNAGSSGGSPSNGSGSSGSGSSGTGNGQNGSSSSKDAGAPDSPDDDDSASDEDEHSNGSSGGQRPGSGPSQPQNAAAVSVIVDLVIAILDLSLGPVRPAEIEALVSAILVLSLAPAELAAESLIAVLDALDDAQICEDHPERCNPLCTNLESDCSACGRDEDCIERIEETCKVKLPRTCR